MKWRGQRQSRNIEDRRGGSGRRIAGGGIGIGAIALFAASIFFPEAVPFMKMVGIGSGGSSTQVASDGTGIDDENRQFVGVTLGLTEEVWAETFREAGAQYKEPVLVMFSGRTTSPCGPATTGSGPFYCPADQKIYIDPAFNDVLARQLGAPGDFAQAYVIAHEVAHHVQNLSGIIPEVNRRKRGASELEKNRLTVRLELQADCYSGFWTNQIQRRRGVLEEGDVQEALNAAFKVGDDTLQGRSGGHVDPASFTHGSSEQRANWFFKGMQAGNISVCDTFNQRYEAL